jgi:protein-tyrosine phosphatase
MHESSTGKKKVLFLCTGNYYRSRFAEIYFNHKAENTNWEAFSRGLELDNENYGEISPTVVKELLKLGIETGKQPYPIEAKLNDLEKADMVICMNKHEHEPMMEEKFPQFKAHAIYWDIADVFERASSSEVPKIVHNIDNLISQLSTQK